MPCLEYLIWVLDATWPIANPCFIKTGGFVKHYQLPSGDDDLFINEVARRKNTRVELIPESHTVSNAKPVFQPGLNKRDDTFTTGKYYNQGINGCWELLLSASFYFILYLSC